MNQSIQEWEKEWDKQRFSQYHEEDNSLRKLDDADRIKIFIRETISLVIKEEREKLDFILKTEKERVSKMFNDISFVSNCQQCNRNQKIITKIWNYLNKQ